MMIYHIENPSVSKIKNRLIQTYCLLIMKDKIELSVYKIAQLVHEFLSENFLSHPRHEIKIHILEELGDLRTWRVETMLEHYFSTLGQDKIQILSRF